MIIDLFRNQILHGNAKEMLSELPAESMHCMVTSPPYYGVRDYKTEPQIWINENLDCQHEFITKSKQSEIRTGKGLKDYSKDLKGGGKKQGEVPTINVTQGFCSICSAWKGQLGLEPTPALYVQHLVSIFREAKRVLRKDGTLWLNLGDSFWGSGNGSGGGEVMKRPKRNAENFGTNGHTQCKHPIFKPKDLIGIPWRVAIALQEDGWYLRSDIIWSKKNPMPESVTDRTSKAHEYMFLLTKSPKYYYDYDAIREDPVTIGDQIFAGRNKRSVWHISTTPYSEAHFATFPEELIEPCILAGTSEHGVCADCGKPYERIVEGQKMRTVYHKNPDKQYKSRGSEYDITPRANSLTKYDTANSTAGRLATCRQGARAYNAKYHTDEEGLFLNASERSITIQDEREESRNEAEKLFPNDRELQLLYINYVHEHGRLRQRITIGWKKTCKCKTDEVRPAIVLDPFFGAGTTGLVARKGNRDFVGIELSEKYIELTNKRLDVHIEKKLL
jgi:DNA modification methylase